MGERVSTEDLEYWLRDLSAMDGEHLPGILEELIERRALDAQHMATIDELVRRRNSDLTSEEREALHCAVITANFSTSFGRERLIAATAALSKLTRGNR